MTDEGRAVRGQFRGDCIHLHACRSLAKRYKSAGVKHVARFCNEGCRCYQTLRSVLLVRPEDAADVARLQYDGASDPYDVYVQDDFPTVRAVIIENGPYCQDENGRD